MADTEEVLQPTLRDTIEQAVEHHTGDDAPEAAAPAAPPDTDAAADTGERPRDEKGRFAPKAGQAEQEPAPQVSAPAAPAADRPKPPSSWKKDYHADWEKIDPRVAAYINEREGQFASGVSTYRSEYERVRPIAEAIAPFLPELQQHGIEPGRWISQLGNAHRVLAGAEPQQKLGMFLKLAQDYQVPLQQLFQQGQDGKVYMNPQVQPYQAQPQLPDINGLVDRRIAEMRSQDAIQNFMQKTDGAGNPAHPHYETVRETMAQLLDAGLAQDLESAYEKAIPFHPDLHAAVIQQKAEADKAEQARKAAEAARIARQKAVSPRSATPASAAPNGKKGLRASIEDAYEEHAAGGRV